MTKKFTMETISLSENNRDIFRTHVDRLKTLIKEQGYIKGLPILVNEEGKIIDGQHRYMACKELGITPDIVVGPDIDLIPLINSTQMKWRVTDYVKYYASKGYPDYIALIELCKKFDLKPSMVYTILEAKMPNRNGLSQKNSTAEGNTLKKGTFKLPDLSEKGIAKVERRIKLTLDLANAMELPKSDRLLVAISKLARDPKFRFDKMHQKIQYLKSRIHRCTTITEYVNMLTGIYNYKSMNKLSL